MATRGIYYFDGLSFALARSLFTDSTLDTLAPDGYYTLGAVSRRQVSGRLENAVICPACGTATDLCYDADSADDVCCPGCSTTLTSFTSTVAGNFSGTCSDNNFTQTYYHNGSGTIPATGDLVYTDSDGLKPLPNAYYHTNDTGTSTFFRTTNSTGFVGLLESC